MSKEIDESIYGIRPVIEAINSGKQVDKILLKQGLVGDLASELLSLIKEQGIPFQLVPYERFAKYGNRNHQGVVAFVTPVELVELESLVPTLFESGKEPFLLILDRITDVRNFGAIVRTAECAGVDAIIVPAKGAAQIGSDSVKTSAGALHHIPICKVGSLKVTLNFLKNSGFRTIITADKGSEIIYDVDFKGPIAVVMGAEDTGVSVDLYKLADSLVRIPIHGKIGSLNVSVAAGVIIYEVVRQRGL
ncbi:MAG: 23S rRNA (guanosine(2251)-2'-O)-methyltransferase RlmB [Bacteroidales bacterium]|nr:MAG: 23S rRNA (guanosine(2251)-2'-O)-methyltransferase RlmB [Bacteroidales bacterium]